MRGSNEFKFNQATMIEAVQYYLEKIMKTPVPVVVSIESKGYDVYTEFTIKVKGEEDGPDQET
jgi:hypothetical protein